MARIYRGKRRIGSSKATAKPPTPAPAVESKADEQVGYKNPPKHTQFKKGQFGNPKGRPKKETLPLAYLALRELGSTIVAVENGKRIRITKKEA
ncbi:MAG: hypothetical protein GC134_05660 [Proteobacteria bacterium]|nr:hypothetical protein [Pseudomonadota bacterium]